MPEIGRDEINKIKTEIKNTQNHIERLDNKIKQSSSKSTELTVYKQNALNAGNLKESAMKILKKLEDEKNLLERKYADLEKKFETSKGHKFVRKDDLIQKAENMKKRKEIFVKFSKILDTFIGESLVLDKTIKILKATTTKTTRTITTKTITTTKIARNITTKTTRTISTISTILKISTK